MIMTSMDLNSMGFAAGSRMVEEDWKDWKSPAMSRDNAKLFLNNT